MKKIMTIWMFAVYLINAQSPVPSGALVERIATGFNFTEGPLWNDTLGLLFSDINADRIYQWSPVDSSTKTYLQPSNSSNGLTYDSTGRLILTQMKLRRIARQESDGTITPLVSTYNGKKFNSPNDLVIKSDGSIYFTDPNWNVPGGQQNQELSFQGVFRFSPAGTLTVIDSSFDKPNGICFSPDEKKLYVNATSQGRIYVWDVVDDSTVANKKVFNSTLLNGYPDGMKADSAGNIFCTGPGGVWIFSPSGEYLDKITMPRGASNPSNCNWGDADRKTLYITAGNSVYKIRLAETVNVEDKIGIPEGFKLYQNYPNPFNPGTNFRFRIAETGYISLKIYDLLGNQVAVAAEGMYNPGEHTVSFTADARMSSGIYVCSLRSGGSVETKKLIFMK